MKKIGVKERPLKNPKRILKPDEVIVAPGIFVPQPESAPVTEPAAVPVEMPQKVGAAWPSPA